MQAIAPVTTAQLLTPGQEPLLKFEIYVAAAWINICDLDGTNYLESISMSFGGATMSPHPIAAKLSAIINNKDAVFHPLNTDSSYSGYFQVGRQVRISLGGSYGGTDYYWQRIIGYIDRPKFSGNTFKVNVSGLDYTQLLKSTELRKLDNYWGTSTTETTIASAETLGAEIYTEADAMDINLEADNVTNWVDTNAAFTSWAEAGGGSTYVGELVLTALQGYTLNENIGSVTAGERYRFSFKYRKTVGIGGMLVGLYETGTSNQMFEIEGLTSAAFVEEVHYFTATVTGAVRMTVRGGANASEFEIDQISLKQVTGTSNSGYPLPAACNGPFYATIATVPFYYRDEGEGWWFDRDNNVFHIENERVVDAGLNLVIHYFTDQIAEEVVADLLVIAGLYLNQGAALTGMEYTPTGIAIEKTWFEVGTSCLKAIEMICERCDYRFYFKYDGTPVFKPFPTAKAPGAEDFTFLSRHTSNPDYHEDINEVRNRIIIEGKKQAQQIEHEENTPSELRAEESDATSITAYGEHTLSINNHLFQDQTSMDAMAATLLARYKDPKWYFDFSVSYNPVPLEIWDTIKAEMLLVVPAYWGSKYDSVRYGTVRYGDSPTVVNPRGLIRDIKISKFNARYKLEEVT